MPRQRKPKTPEQLKELALKEERRKVRLMAKRQQEQKDAEVRAEWRKHRRELSQLLNDTRIGTATPGNKCKLCGNHIDAAKREELVAPHQHDGWHINFAGARGWRTHEEMTLHALQWLPRICHPCFTDHDSKFKLARALTRRLTTKIIDHDDKPALTQDRRHDLFLLLIKAVAHHYGYNHHRHYDNDHRNGRLILPDGVLSVADRGTARYWYASTVYRRLRRRLGLKGRVCAWLCDYDPFENPKPRYANLKKLRQLENDLFRGKEVVEMEKEIYDGSLPYGSRKDAAMARELTEDNHGRLTINNSLRKRLAAFKAVKREKERNAAEKAEREGIQAMPAEIERLRARIAELEGKPIARDSTADQYWIHTLHGTMYWGHFGPRYLLVAGDNHDIYIGTFKTMEDAQAATKRHAPHLFAPAYEEEDVWDDAEAAE